MALLWPFVAVCARAVGCGGSKLKTEFVEGTVLVDGSSVEGAFVAFDPVAGGTGVTASGVTDVQGRCLLTSERGGGVDKGAVAGVYEVGISKSENIAPKPTPQELEEASKNGEDLTKKYPVEYKYHVPKKYILPQFSGLTATVVAGKNKFDFDLRSEE